MPGVSAHQKSDLTHMQLSIIFVVSANNKETELGFRHATDFRSCLLAALQMSKARALHIEAVPHYRQAQTLADPQYFADQLPRKEKS